MCYLTVSVLRLTWYTGTQRRGTRTYYMLIGVFLFFVEFWTKKTFRREFLILTEPPPPQKRASFEIAF